MSETHVYGTEQLYLSQIILYNLDLIESEK